MVDLNIENGFDLDYLLCDTTSYACLSIRNTAILVLAIKDLYGNESAHIVIFKSIYAYLYLHD